MLKKLLCGACFLILASGCASPTHPEIKANSEIFTRTRNVHSEGMTALRDYSTGKDCNGSNATTVKKSIAYLEESLIHFNNAQYIGTGSYWSEKTKERHLELAFGFADESLKNRCLDNADNAYRQLISFYVGEAYSGIRDRAKLGIDDIRSLRNKK